jgi:solute carrier family 25 carnitine/acylcarnitine transporter 20/29
VYFTTYEVLKQKLSPREDGKNRSIPGLLLSGGIAGSVSWASTYPVDVVKTRLQTAKRGAYKGVLDCVSKCWQEGGVRIFFKGRLFHQLIINHTLGLFPTLVRSFPVNASIFFVYDYLTAALGVADTI